MDYSKACELLKSLGADLSSFPNTRSHAEMVLSQTPNASPQMLKDVASAVDILRIFNVAQLNEKISTIVKERYPSVDDAGKIELSNELVAAGRQLQLVAPPTPDLNQKAELALVCLRFVASTNSYMRMCGLRIIRSYIWIDSFADTLWFFKGHWFVAQSIERDGKTCGKEREQAFKVVQQLVYNAERCFVPTPIVLRLVALGETNEDGLKRKCVELLRDLFIKSPKSVALGGGIKLLLSCALDTMMMDLMESVLDAVLTALETPQGRTAIRLYSDLTVLLAPFTEKLPMDKKLFKEAMNRMKLARNAILHIGRTWGGLFWLGSDPQGIRTLIDVLYLPGATERKMIIFELLNSLLKGAAPHRAITQKGPWTTFVEDGDLLPKVQTPDLVSIECGSFVVSADREPAIGDIDTALLSDNIHVEDTNAHVVNVHMFDTFLGCILLMFEREGLTKALVTLVREGTHAEESFTSQSAAQLLQQIHVIMETLFPREAVLNLHTTFDAVISQMLSERKGEDLALGSDKVKTLMAKLQHEQDSVGNRSTSLHLGNIKLQMATTMDDSAFQALVKETQVLNERAWAKWNVEAIMTLIRGPLRRLPRLKEIGDRFFQRILEFLKPSKNLFNSMTREPKFTCYATLAYRTVELLLMTKEGTAFLAESGLMNEIYEKLLEVTNPKIPDNTRVFNKEHLTYHMTREYFRLIGKCCDHPNGISLLLQVKMFDILLTLVSLSSDSLDPSDVRNDICHQILKHINFGYVPNYGVNMAARPILITALTKGSNAIRYFATKELRRTLSSSFNENIQWVLALLTQQLADKFRGVSEAALGMICDLCIADEEALELLIQNNPPLSILMETEMANVLLLAMLRTPTGFDLLMKCNWIEKQVDKWTETGSANYASTLENSLRDFSSGMTTRPNNAGSRIAHHRTMSNEFGGGRYVRPTVPGTVPQHFLGELCKTEQGCLWLKEKKATWSKLVSTVKAGISISNAQATANEQSELLDILKNDEMECEAALQKLKQCNQPPTALVSVSAPSDSVAHHEYTVSNRSYGTKLTTTDAAVKETRCANTVEFRGALWAIAHIASSECGFHTFLEGDHELLTLMVNVVSGCETLSMRGFMLTLIGLVARSQGGRLALERLGFVVTIPYEYRGSNNQPYSACFAYPTEFSQFSTIPTAEFNGSAPTIVQLSHSVVPSSVVPLSSKDQDILRCVGNLTSPVLHESAMKEIRKLASIHPATFAKPELYVQVLRTLSYARCKTVYRRQIYELFAAQIGASAVMDSIRKIYVRNSNLN
eukprot:PhF_6_TR512/c0_g1_i1/m.291/K08267/RICTOR; rapamycin-insensitive companion of mTOR